jgi:hypothetical protein
VELDDRPVFRPDAFRQLDGVLCGAERGVRAFREIKNVSQMIGDICRRTVEIFAILFGGERDYLSTKGPIFVAKMLLAKARFLFQ